MTKEEQALSTLREISLPPPVPYRPESIGWYVLAALVFAAACYLFWRLYKWWQANGYRRAALVELKELERQLEDATRRPRALSLLPQLIKQTALCAYPRSTVASLSESRWLTFLDESYRDAEFTNGPGKVLPMLAYGQESYLTRVSDSEVKALLSLVRSWILHHHAHL